MINTLDSFIKENYSVLDVGCGIGTHIQDLKCAKLVGIDAFDYSDKYPGNFIQLLLPDLSSIENNSYDVILCLDVIEHLTKEDGFILLNHFERISRRIVYIYTPAEWDSNESSTNDPNCWAFNNPYNLHKSLWKINDFQSLNYKTKQKLDFGWTMPFIHALKERP